MVKIRLGFFLNSGRFFFILGNFISNILVHVYGAIPSLKIKAIRLVGHSVFAFKGSLNDD